MQSNVSVHSLAGHPVLIPKVRISSRIIIPTSNNQLSIACSLGGPIESPHRSYNRHRPIAFSQISTLSRNLRPRVELKATKGEWPQPLDDDDEESDDPFQNYPIGQNDVTSQLTEEEKATLQFGLYIGEDPEITYKKVLAKRTNPDTGFYELEKLMTGKGQRTSSNLPDKVIVYKKTTEGVSSTETVLRKPPAVTNSQKKEEAPAVSKPAPVLKLKSPPRFSGSGPVPEPVQFSEAVRASRRQTPAQDLDEVEIADIADDIRMQNMGKAPISVNVLASSAVRRPMVTVIDSGLPPAGLDFALDDEFDDVIDELRNPKRKKSIPSSLLRKPRLPAQEVEEEKVPAGNATEDDVQEQRGGSIIDSASPTVAAARLAGAIPEIQEAAPVKDTPAVEPILAAQDVGPQEKVNISAESASPIKVRNVPTLKLTKPPTLPPVKVQEAGTVSEVSSFTLAWSQTKEASWAEAERLFNSKEFLVLPIVGVNNGGILVAFGALQGFVPCAELVSDKKPISMAEWLKSKGLSKFVSKQNPDGVVNEAGKEAIREEYVKERKVFLSSLVGRNIRVHVSNVDKSKRTLILSAKEARLSDSKAEAMERKEALMRKLSEGDVVKGIVKLFVNFGAFVEVEGVEALVHISELSWSRVEKVDSVLRVGQEIEAKVIKLDAELNRIQLSIKRLQPDPLLSTLDSLVDGYASWQPDSEAADQPIVDDIPELLQVLSRLQEIPDIGKVSIARRLSSTAIAPGFQLYLSDKTEDGYRLIARLGQQVQEVLVETNVDRDAMKAAITESLVLPADN